MRLFARSARCAPERCLHLFPGQWIGPDLTEGDRLVVAVDVVAGRVFIDSSNGQVWIVDGDGDYCVNSSLEAFVECARAYTSALKDAGGLDPDDDDGFDRIEAHLLRYFREIDPSMPLADESFWIVAAGEIGSGHASFADSAASVTPPSAQLPSAPPTRIMIALADEARVQLFTAEEWKEMSSLGQVTLVRAPRMIAVAIDIAAQQATARGNEPPRPSVLIVNDIALVDEDVLVALPALRLVCAVGDQRAEWSPAAEGIEKDLAVNGADVVASVRAFLRD